MFPRWLALSLCLLVACGDNRDTDPCRIACPAAPNPTCEGNTVVTYGEATCAAEGTAASCTYDQTRVDCTATFQLCASGACVAPNDPCASTTCSTAPASTCTGTVLHTYDPNGRCDSSTGSGVCAYTPHDIDCAITNQLCENGACVDPCNGVACTTPPPDACTGTMSTTYAANGTCASTTGTAVCHYDATTTNCAAANGACDLASGHCTAPCTGVTCTTPPAASCSNGSSTTYAATGTCDGTSGTAVCDYTPTTVSCADAHQVCDGASGLCVDPCQGVTCSTPPPPSCGANNVSTTYSATGTCDGSTGSPVCSYAATAKDCAAIGQTCDGATGLCTDPCTGVSCTTPPPPHCDATTPTTSISFAAAGTCDSTSGSPVCTYAATPTDCTATNQTCDPATGLCADPCTLTSCTTPPSATCANNTLTTYASPGTCGASNGVPTCSYAPTETPCGAGFCQASTASCLADCGGSNCTTPPAATCAGDVLTTYAATGTCDTTGAPVCVYAPATTDCTLTDQTCSGGACTGPVVIVRTQSPATITDLVGTPQTVYARIYIQGITDQNTSGNDALGFLDVIEFGIGTGVDPTLYAYDQLAVPNPAYTGDEPAFDEYMDTFLVAGTAGSVLHYAYRLSRDGGTTWLYGDLGAAGSSDGFTTPGTLNVAAPFFSEYIEGSSNNKAVEIYNPGSVSFSLSGCVIRQWTNAATAPTTVFSFAATDSIAATGVITFCQATLVGPLPCTKTTPSTSLWNGNDTVELFCGTSIVDSIGKESENPATWGTDPTTTDHTLLRHCDVFAGDPIATDAFDPATQFK
ncbi:MAG TPA: hypothetical protein VIV58_38195, partial [Kofleriaceae bacterium]